MLDWIWLLIAIPLAFGFGWFFSRLDIYHWRVEARHQPKAYFQGLHHLLSGQQDHAIDSFIEAVQNDPDTSELHFTLGNLFRRRGEYDRAVRVHQHLLARADISPVERERAQMALAQDFVKAGLLDRAETALLGSRLGLPPLQSLESQKLLLYIYERGRDWPSADSLAQKLQLIDALGNYDKRRAHYLCEQGLWEQAMTLSPVSPRAYIALAKRQMAEENWEASYQLLDCVARQTPQALPLIAASLLRCAQDPQRRKNVLDLLMSAYQKTRSLDILQTLIEGGSYDKKHAYQEHFESTQSLVAATYLVPADISPAAIQKAIGPLMRYRCASCGFEVKEYFWHCPGCLAWDTYPFKRVEEL